jgi:hypothetical protein
MTSFHPGGVVEVDAKSVVSIQPATPYSVLPEEAGLLQLLHRGDLMADGYGNMTFVINRQIRFPAELYGPHLRHFLLPPGVPMPSGDPGHSCVKSEETGKILTNNGSCRGLWLGLQALR